ncbi:MAG: HepT-like ribonuclease domain-containing protein [bacterium]
MGSVQDMRLETFSTDIRSQRFVERTLHIAIECCLDICHHVIFHAQSQRQNRLSREWASPVSLPSRSHGRN